MYRTTLCAGALTRFAVAIIPGILDTARAADMPVGIFSPDRDSSARWLEQLSFVIEGSDAMYLSLATDAAFAPLKTGKT